MPSAIAPPNQKICALPVQTIRANLPAVRAVRALDQRERDKIAGCPEGALDVALEPA